MNVNVIDRSAFAGRFIFLTGGKEDETAGSSIAFYRGTDETDL